MIKVILFDCFGVLVGSSLEAFYDTPVNTPLIEFIRDTLKPKYRIGMLSNAADNWLDELFSADDQALFEHAVLSYQVGLAKPDPGIYNAAVERFGVEPEQCLFVDDKERNCDAARGVGMQALTYKNFSQFQRDISHVLGSG